MKGTTVTRSMAAGAPFGGTRSLADARGSDERHDRASRNGNGRHVRGTRSLAGERLAHRHSANRRHAGERGRLLTRAAPMRGTTVTRAMAAGAPFGAHGRLLTAMPLVHS